MISMKFPAFDPIELKNDIEVGITNLSLMKIVPNKEQPRKNFDNISLEELSLSIRQYGVLQPIIVKKLDENKYQIIAGERRWRASVLAGLKEIPAIVKTNDYQNNMAISLIENIQREELNPIELSEAFYELNTTHGLSHEVIATMMGKQRATVTNLLRLLNLCLYVRELLASGKLDIGHAKALLPLSAEQQIMFANRIIENGLTVRDVEKLVQLYKVPQSQKSKISLYTNLEKVQEWERTLSKNLSTKVAVKINEKGVGRVVINIESTKEIEWLIKKFEN